MRHLLLVVDCALAANYFTELVPPGVVPGMVNPPLLLAWETSKKISRLKGLFIGRDPFSDEYPFDEYPFSDFSDE